MKRLLTYICTIAILIESTGLTYLKPQAPQMNSCLRPMASAVLKSINTPLSAKTERLRQQRSDNPYHPHNILTTFKKKNLSWKSIPKEYLTPEIEILVKELSGLLEKDPYELRPADFRKFVFPMPSGKKKWLRGLLDFIIREYNLSNEIEAVGKIKEVLGIRQSLWSSNDWRKVKQLFKPMMKPNLWRQIKTEKDLNTYLYSHKITKEQEFLLAGLISKGRGNKAALSALIYSHLGQIENYANRASGKYRLDPAGLMDYIIRRLETASLSFEPEIARYATFIRGPMGSARYDYMRVIKGTRRKAKLRSYPQSQDEEAERFEANIPDRKEPVLYYPENELIIDKILKALWISERNRKIFIMVKVHHVLQKEVASKFGLVPVRISQIIKDVSSALAPYEGMTKKVIRGDMLLEPLLGQIEQDRAGSLQLTVDKKMLQAFTSQA